MEASFFLEQLSLQSARLGLPLSDSQKAQCTMYLSLLQEWNQKMNLTAITDPKRILEYHFIDSLTLVSMLPNIEAASLMDVGSGAGFPGVICSILQPTYAVTLVERIQKKAVFLLAVRRALGLSFQVVSDEISHLQHMLHQKTAMRPTEQPDTRSFRAPFATFHPAGLYDIAVSRATFAPEQWAQIGATLVKQGGFIFVMLGQKEKEVPCPKGCKLLNSLHYKIEGGTRHIQCFQREDVHEIEIP